MKDKAVRLLLVEDDKVDQIAFERYVRNENLPYDYTIAGSVAEGKEILQATHFDVIIADYVLGDGVSFELFELFKDTPVIVTTGTGNEEVAVEAMKLGASDYLIKDPDGHYLKTLPTTVELALKRKQNEKELRNYHEHLAFMVVERTTELNQSLDQERNLTRIIEQSLNEIFIFDADSYKFLFVNEGARVNLGYSHTELLKMTPLDIKSEIDAPSFEKIVTPLQIGKQEKVVFETVHRRKDGSTYPVEVHFQKTEYHSTPVFVAVVLDITQRKKMEQRYQELVEGTTDLITQVDAEGKLLYVNHMGKEIFGPDPGQLIGQDAFQFVHFNDRERTVAWFENCLNKKVLQDNIENRQINQETGAAHDMLWSTNFHYDELGKVASINGIAHDITDRKMVEIAIRKSEEQWGRTFNSFTDIVTLQDPDLHIVKCNRAACTTLDLSYDEIIGHRCYELFVDGSNEPCQDCPLLETKKTFEPYNREMYHKKLGKTFLVSASPVFDEQGNLEYIAHVAKDVTDIKESEKERLRLATAIEQATESVVITDLKGSIQYVNPAFEKLTGYSRKEALGQNSHILSSGKHDQAFYKKMWTTLLQGEVWSGHLTNKKKDGTLFEEELTISPVRNNEGQITNFVAVKRDVSKEIALEKQLQHAIKMEAIGTLAGGIAHDFNNILAAIISYAQIIKNEVAADSRVGKDIAEVLAAGQRAANLVKQILTFSRKTETEKQPLQPHLIVEEVLKMMEASFPSTIQIETDIDADCGLIMADPTNIHQVTVNLCTNSLHAMADQKGTLGISLQRCELSAAEMTGEPILSPGSYVVLTVNDTGCGMDKATMERIFDPFYTTKEVDKGTGLGLAVIHGIVRDAQGFIRIKSTVGEGSSFAVYFPILQEKISTAHESDQRVPLQGGSEHILIVDDEPLLVRATQRQLEDLGYRVTGTTNSKDALEKMSTSPDEFDLLITDQTMPGLTGAELALAAMEIKPDLPVILCTGHSDLPSKKKALAAGIKEYIAKPLVGDRLFRAVRSVLDGK